MVFQKAILKNGLAINFVALFSIVVLMMPLLAFATSHEVTDVDTLLDKALGLLNKVIPILMVLALLFFIWSVISYVFKKVEEDKKIAKQNMIWGIIALFVIVAVWGLVNVLINTFGFDDADLKLKQVPTITL